MSGQPVRRTEGGIWGSSQGLQGLASPNKASRALESLANCSGDWGAPQGLQGSLVGLQSLVRHAGSTSTAGLHGEQPMTCHCCWEHCRVI